MAFRLGWSSQPDGRLGFEGGSGNSPFEVGQFWIRVEFTVKKIKENYFVFIKIKGYRYEGELGSKKIATVPQQWRQKTCWYFLTQT
jgi:hypothetical protein